MAADPITDWMAYAAMGVSLLALLISWQGYRLAKRQVLHKRPYLDRQRFEQDGTIRLNGPDTANWEINSVKLIWPNKSQFGFNEVEYDFGGSIVRSTILPVGRVLRDTFSPVFLAGDSKSGYALVSASSKTRPKISQRWVIRVKSRA